MKKAVPAHKRTGSQLTDLKGQQCGELYVLFRVAQGKHHRPQWRCLCSCGRRITTAHNRLIDKKRPKLHCGCKNQGLPHHNKREYHAWTDARARCHHKHHPSYPYYGAHGIRMCVEWRNSFEAFLKHVGPRPSDEHSIDRIDPYGNYEPGNVRWADKITQARNKKGTLWVTHLKTGKKIRAAEYAEELNLTYQAFRGMMISKGLWPTEG